MTTKHAKKLTAPSTPSLAPNPQYVDVRRRGSSEWIYYRRKGALIPLPGPIGSPAFHTAYDRAAATFRAPLARGQASLHTVQDGITHYLGSPAYRQLATHTRDDYRRQLDAFRSQFGNLRLAAMDEPWIGGLRRKYAPDPTTRDAGAPDAWNRLRSRMIAVVEEYRADHPGVLPSNPWKAGKRLKAPARVSHRPWPAAALSSVLQAATPEFRALIVAYLLTAQRGGDVTKFSPKQYDSVARTLTLRQGKTDTPQLLHVPEQLAIIIESMRGRSADRLLVTPRGKAWTTSNAQETLAALLRNIGLPRLTLHGLRATGPVALKMMGWENRGIRSLTGHDSDRSLEVYLQGVERYPLAHEAQEALAVHFGEVLDDAAAPSSNQRRFAGLTGRASAKAKAQSANSVQTANQNPAASGKKAA
jgi:integrase